jgi:hypothetical protein
VGQEIVYCFKCQKRILGTEMAKGLAYQVGNQFCCSTCVVLVLDTLAPKAKEELLAKMFKATQERQSGSTQSLKALGATSPAASTRRIPTTTGNLTDHSLRPTVEETSSTPMVVGIFATVVVVALLILLLSSGSSSSPPPINTVKRVAPPPPPPDSGPSPEEKRRGEAAKQAMSKALAFAQANPKDVDGQALAWRAALLEAERTGYEVEARRELEKAEARVKEAAAKQVTDFDRQLRELLGKKDFKAVQDLLDQARGKSSAPEWTSMLGRLQLATQDAAARSFAELKEKAVSSRDRGAKAEVDAAKAEVTRWGFPQYVTELETVLSEAWRPIFDGKTTKFLSTDSQKWWGVVDGALCSLDVKHYDAGQSREDFGDGEIRFRFVVQGASQLSFTVRQASAGAVRAMFYRPELNALPSGEHEVIFACRGSEITATLDGKAHALQINGKVLPKGRIQFGTPDGVFRVSAVEYRPLP